MIKILDTILKIEDESKTKVLEAQKKAREIKESAEKKNSDRLTAVREETEALLLAAMNNSKKEWEDKYRNLFSLQEAVYSDFIKTKHAEIESTAEKIVTMITKPQHKTDYE